jgi:hypothetical protein
MSLIPILAAVIAAAPTGSGDAPLPYRLTVGMELVYAGTHTETVSRTGERTRRTWDLETRILVLPSPNGPSEIAVVTKSTLRTDNGKPAPPPAIRLELARIESNGAVRFVRPLSLPAIPLEGPPTVDIGAFVASPPDGQLASGKTWDALDERQNVRTWRVEGIDWEVRNTVRLVGTTQTAAKGDQPAWSRKETVWRDTYHGYGSKFRREILIEGTGSNSPRISSETSVELRPPFHFAGRFLEPVRRDINQALAFDNDLAELLRGGAFSRPDEYQRLISGIDRYLRVQMSPTEAYRDVIRAIRRRAETAMHGNRPPEMVVIAGHQSVEANASKLSIGLAVPDFLATDVASRETIRLSQWRGRPVLLFCCKPSSKLTPLVLQTAQAKSAQWSNQIHVVVIVTEGQIGTILKMRTDHGLTMPVLDGSTATSLLKDQPTPRILLIDSSGQLRFLLDGWGAEYPELLGKIMEQNFGK